MMILGYKGIISLMVFEMSLQWLIVLIVWSVGKVRNSFQVLLHRFNTVESQTTACCLSKMKISDLLWEEMHENSSVSVFF